MEYSHYGLICMSTPRKLIMKWLVGFFSRVKNQQQDLDSPILSLGLVFIFCQKEGIFKKFQRKNAIKAIFRCFGYFRPRIVISVIFGYYYFFDRSVFFRSAVGYLTGPPLPCLYYCICTGCNTVECFFLFCLYAMTESSKNLN